MKILVVADKVEDYIYSPGLKDRMPDVELVLSCGDLPFYYLEFIVSSLDVPLLYVFGNHNTYEYRRGSESGLHDIDSVIDSMFQIAGRTSARQIKYAPEGCINLDGHVIRHNGLVLSGLEGSIRYRPGASHQYTEDQMRTKVTLLSLRLVLARLRWGQPLDILITHSPPYRIHDGQDPAHRGFRAFLTFMDRFGPRYLIHGHRHVYHLQRPEVTQYGQTTVINVYGHSLMEVTPSNE